MRPLFPGWREAQVDMTSLLSLVMGARPLIEQQRQGQLIQSRLRLELQSQSRSQFWA